MINQTHKRIKKLSIQITNQLGNRKKKEQQSTIVRAQMHQNFKWLRY